MIFNQARQLCAGALLLSVLENHLFASDEVVTENRVYLRDRCIVSDDGTEPRLLPVMLTMLVSFAATKGVEFIQTRLDEAGKVKKNEASAQRALYLFQRTADGVSETPSFGCIIFVRGKFVAERGKPYIALDPMEDTFSSPVVFATSGEDAGTVRSKLAKNGIRLQHETDPEIIYEVELERLDDGRYFQFSNRYFHVAVPLGTRKANRAYNSIISIFADGKAIASEPFELVKMGVSTDGAKKWTKEAPNASNHFLFGVMDSQAKMIAAALKLEVDRQEEARKAWNEYHAAAAGPGRDRIARRIQNLAVPGPSLFAPVTIKVEITETEDGNGAAKFLGEFLKSKNADITKAITEALPLPSILEEKEKKAATAAQQAIAAMLAACKARYTDLNVAKDIAEYNFKAAWKALNELGVKVDGLPACDLTPAVNGGSAQ